jgi:hypothetical protein
MRLFRIHAVAEGRANLSAYETADCEPTAEACSTEPGRLFSVTVVVHAAALTEADTDSTMSLNAGDHAEVLLTARPGIALDHGAVHRCRCGCRRCDRHRWALARAVHAFDVSAIAAGTADVHVWEVPDCPPAAPCILVAGRLFSVHVAVVDGDAQL